MRRQSCIEEANDECYDERVHADPGWRPAGRRIDARLHRHRRRGALWDDRLSAGRPPP